MSTVASALAEARARGVAALDAQLLLARILTVARTGILANDERPLDEAQRRAWSRALARRAAGEPLAYVLGEKEFHGLCLEVDRTVLVPRPETEAVVDWASELISAAAAMRHSSLAVLDLGTGSGAIALALKHRHPKASVTATDVSREALATAGRNAARLGLRLELLEGSWWQPLDERSFDVVVANPPYVADGDPHLAALRHEPRVALTPGADAVAAIAEIAGQAVAHLRPGGALIVEHGFDQAEATRDLFARAGLVEVATRADLAGQPRATAGRRAVPLSSAGEQPPPGASAVVK